MISKTCLLTYCTYLLTYLLILTYHLITLWLHVEDKLLIKGVHQVLVLAEERSTQFTTFTPAAPPRSMRLSSLVPKQPRGQSRLVRVARLLRPAAGPKATGPPQSAGNRRSSPRPIRFVRVVLTRLTCTSPVSLAGLTSSGRKHDFRH